MAYSTGERFGTVINCIDGRAQQPASDWVRLNCGVEYVDAITTPGADLLLSGEFNERAQRIKDKVLLSAKKHDSGIVAVVGHHDCSANQCDESERKDQIQKAALQVRSWKTGLRVVGLFVNEWHSVEVVIDTNDDYPPVRSYL